MNNKMCKFAGNSKHFLIKKKKCHASVEKTHMSVPKKGQEKSR